MLHEMKLQEKYYNYILKGTKRIELRLNDEKRRKINLGDKIKFLNIDNPSESLEVQVIGLLRYESFSDLVADYDISILADRSMTKEELLNVLIGFYPKDEELKYGVLGIRFVLNHNLEDENEE